ncbi:MAG: DUF4340 domain-containing protein [Treponema sp.]|jgi:hypothetical protein|nr:DUF4340 domain-containing protein [Treponema sp.]
MTYNKKLFIHIMIIAALVLAYTLGIVFDPERTAFGSDLLSWIDPQLVDRIDRIAIESGGETKELIRKNAGWFVSHNGKDYPARQMRVEVFIDLLAKRAPYPVRSSNASSHERLGLTENDASRILVSGGVGLPLLDLLVGQGDNTGQEVYLRRRGQNEARSGEDVFTSYTESPRASWYNLRLFPESENGSLDADSVQRLTVYAGAQMSGNEDGDGSDADAYGDTAAAPAELRVFTRNGMEWIFSGIHIAEADMNKVDSYVRGILNVEGDDFSDSDEGDLMFNHSRITLELEDGSVKTVRLGPPDETGRRLARVSGSPYTYSLAGWAAERLFRDTSFFEKQ